MTHPTRRQELHEALRLASLSARAQRHWADAQTLQRGIEAMRDLDRRTPRWTHTTLSVFAGEVRSALRLAASYGFSR